MFKPLAILLCASNRRYKTVDEFKPHSKPVMFRLLFLIYSRLKHKIFMSVLQTCRNSLLEDALRI